MKKVTERLMTTKQAVDQMNHYWKNMSHSMVSDVQRKKSMDKRFGIKDIKLDKYGNIISFNKYKRGQFEQIESFSKFLEEKQSTAAKSPEF